MWNKYGKHYNMSRKAANDTLKNVLAACNIESENINFDLLVLKGFAQTNIVDTCKWIAIGFLFLTLIAPLALINNDLKLETNNLLNNDRIIIEDHQLYDDHFTLKLAGEDIDYDAIYAMSGSGNAVFPIKIDQENSMVSFPYNNEALTIHITDKHGHTLDAVLSGTLNKQ